MWALPKIPGHSITKLSACELWSALDGANCSNPVTLNARTVIAFSHFSPNRVCIFAKHRRRSRLKFINFVFIRKLYRKIFHISRMNPCLWIFLFNSPRNGGIWHRLLAGERSIQFDHVAIGHSHSTHSGPVLGVFPLDQPIRKSRLRISQLTDVVPFMNRSPLTKMSAWSFPINYPIRRSYRSYTPGHDSLFLTILLLTTADHSDRCLEFFHWIH